MRWLAMMLLIAAPTRAEVVKFEVLSQGPALEGRVFGAAGPAAMIQGRATIALDPADPRNAVIADLALAPRNAQGRVEAVTDVVILRPERPNETLLFEVLNRGRKLLPGWTQDMDTAAGIRLQQASDAGNGFLLEAVHPGLGRVAGGHAGRAGRPPAAGAHDRRRHGAVQG